MLSISEAMSDALEAGARRRAVAAAALMTPPGRGAIKRGLKASPAAESTQTTKSTVTPDAKRHQSTTVSDSASVLSVGSGSDGNVLNTVVASEVPAEAETQRDEEDEVAGLDVGNHYIIIYILYINMF